MRTYVEVMRIHIKATALHNYCKEQGISRDELARRMGISSASAYRIDAGKSAPSNEFIAALMFVTGKSFDDLFEVRRDAAA